MFNRKGLNSKSWKAKMRIAMFIKKGQNSSVWKDKIKILMFIKIEPEFQC